MYDKGCGGIVVGVGFVGEVGEGDGGCVGGCVRGGDVGCCGGWRC